MSQNEAGRTVERIFANDRLADHDGARRAKARD